MQDSRAARVTTFYVSMPRAVTRSTASERAGSATSVRDGQVLGSFRRVDVGVLARVDGGGDLVLLILNQVLALLDVL